MDWDKPTIVVVLPLGLRPGGLYPYGTVALSVPRTPAGWAATVLWLARLREVAENQPVGAVVQRPNQPAIRRPRRPVG